MDQLPARVEIGTDEDQLNAISLMLGRTINLAFDGSHTETEWSALQEARMEWRKQLPEYMHSYCSTGDSQAFPYELYLQDCHGRLWLHCLYNKV